MILLFRFIFKKGYISKLINLYFELCFIEKNGYLKFECLSSLLYIKKK